MDRKCFTGQRLSKQCVGLVYFIVIAFFVPKTETKRFALQKVCVFTVWVRSRYKNLGILAKPNKRAQSSAKTIIYYWNMGDNCSGNKNIKDNLNKFNSMHSFKIAFTFYNSYSIMPTQSLKHIYVQMRTTYTYVAAHKHNNVYNIHLLNMGSLKALSRVISLVY